MKKMYSFDEINNCTKISETLINYQRKTIGKSEQKK